MAALPLKSFRMEQRTIVRFLWVKGHNANAIHSEMRSAYGDKCFMRLKTAIQKNEKDY